MRHEEKANCFTLLKRITKLKIVNSEIRSEVRTSYLERYSCHLDDSSMSHALTQNCHCEFCCGTHLTCKNISITPNRSGSMKGTDKYQKATIAIASAEEENWKLTLPCQQNHIAPKLTFCGNGAANCKKRTWRFLG